MKKKSPAFTKGGIISISFSLILILSYMLTVFLTYDKVGEMAHDNLLKSALSSATSFSKVLNSDLSYLKYASEDFASSNPKTSPDEYNAYLKKLISRKNSTTFNKLIYVQTDGSYYCSDGVAGRITDFQMPETIKEGTPGIASDREAKSYKESVDAFTFIYFPIFKDGEAVGLLAGAFEYSSSLTEFYPVAYYSDKGINLILDEKGDVLLSSYQDDDEELGNMTNFFSYIKTHKASKEISQYKNDNGDVTSAASDIIVGDSKYAFAYSKVEGVNGFDNLYIARVIPSSLLFSQTGNLLSFLTMASMFFFFGIVVMAYKFYKTVNASSEKIRNIAYVDPLTGFANFAKFKEDSKEILQTHRDQSHYMCCADMVGFRYINDAFGYDMGDKILIEITKQINDLLDEDEVFSRISGDKFVILTTRDLSQTDTELFLYKLTDRISTIEPLAKSRIRLEVQMGIYQIGPDDVDTMSINAMYDRSLVALYTIEHVDTGIAVYDASIHNEQIEKKSIESKMHEALQNGEFRVYVQPKYKTSNARLAAGEALIRWVDPEKGIVPPAKFIPLFEQNRFVHDVDLYVMEVVSRFLRMRINEGLPVVPISLNISPVEISMPNFQESYISIKEKYDIPDKLIELEFTEGIFFDNEDYFRSIIKNFQEHGFTCSIDDFGSGYSSLNILKSLPVDVLKLDRLFFRESDDISRDRSVVRSVVAMARALNIKTVAEGVETLDAVEFLKLIGCTLIQGYIYSKPLPLTEFEEKLNNENLDTENGYELDFDKFESVPLDVPISSTIDNSMHSAYSAICEINIGGNIYHMFYPNGSKSRFDKIPERGFYSAFLGELAPKFVHPNDIEDVEDKINPINLVNHFKTNTELNFEYRHLRLDGSFSWMKMHVIKASGGRSDSQIYFIYFNVIDNYKETEERLEAFQSRFSIAYSKLNGTVFELDTTTKKIEVLESHSNILSAVSEIKEYDKIREFIIKELLHPDYKEVLSTVVTVENLCKYFKESGNATLTVEVQAKGSRKNDYYNYFETSYAVQPDANKILVTIEDISDRKAAEAVEESTHKVIETAFANVYDRTYHIHLDKDSFEGVEYINSSINQTEVTEGKYSLYFKSSILESLKEEDRETIDQVLSLEALTAFYDDEDTNQFSIAYQARSSVASDEYEWFESLVVALPISFGNDKNVYMFRRSIDERKETEKNLNEYAHRLSYSLAMYDYAYTVDTNTEEVEIIGGLRFDSDLLNDDDVTYNKITMHVKNTEIAEEDQSTFRRATYLDELVEYFSSNPATIIKYFSALNDPKRLVEVSLIYGSRESKITIFIRRIDKDAVISHIKDELPAINSESNINSEIQTVVEESVAAENKKAADIQKEIADMEHALDKDQTTRSVFKSIFEQITDPGDIFSDRGFGGKE